MAKGTLFSWRSTDGRISFRRSAVSLLVPEAMLCTLEYLARVHRLLVYALCGEFIENKGNIDKYPASTL
jgi:hypothetical protein